jgi:uncharacterized membrane protein (UPF0127 family)
MPISSKALIFEIVEHPDRLASSKERTSLKPLANSQLQAVNLTRQTVLADRLEVADHGANRRKGLLGRDGLLAGQGLWIKPCEAVHTFCMRFAIDLVYLDRKNRIRKVRSGVRPWRISSCLTAHSVIELPSGTVQATQSKPGDQVEFSMLPAR